MATGKDICNQLKKIRAEIAKQNGIEFTPVECNNKENCIGTCPMCEQEVEYLQKKLEEKRHNGTLKSIDEENIIPVEKLKVSDSEKEQLKNIIKLNSEKKAVETKQKQQISDSIEVIEKALCEEWANIEFDLFSKFNPGWSYVTTGTYGDIEETKKGNMQNFLDGQTKKIHCNSTQIKKAEEIENLIFGLEKFRTGNHDIEEDEVTYILAKHIKKEVVADRISFLQYNKEKLKDYNPEIPNFGFTEEPDPETTIELKEKIESCKKEGISKLEKDIDKLADRWNIEENELYKNHARLSERLREKDAQNGPTAPVFGIRRHCLGSDGKGVTTLVTLKGCPLNCQYCLNGQNSLSSTPTKYMTVDELIETLKVDDLYFRSTGGGVTFGGGEPLLYHRFIEEFISKKPSHWKVNIETSLNVPNIDPWFFKNFDLIIVDCKDMNNIIYNKYTGKDNDLVYKNLKDLQERYSLDKESYEMGLITDNERAKFSIKVRVPLIKGYNTPEDQKESIRILNEMGITNIEEFEYIVPD